MKKQSSAQKPVRGVAIFILLFVVFFLQDNYLLSWSNPARYIVWTVIAAISVYGVVRAVDSLFGKHPK